MPDSGLFVYRASRDAHAQITQLSDFISPTIVAMWNLRWQVMGFLAAHPSAKQSDLVARFAHGANLKANEVKRASVDISWEEQQARFASILLTNTVAIFEDFAEQICGLTLSGDLKRKAYKDLQYPASGGKGYPRAYAAFGVDDPVLTGVFRQPGVLSRWYSDSELQNLLMCFRFFKEIRNALTHNGGRATPELVDAYGQFAPVATISSLGVKEVPEHQQPVLGQVVRLSLRGVYGFSDVVLRLIATHDGNLSERTAARLDINASLGSITGPARARVDAAKQAKRIAGLLQQAGLPPGNQTPPFREFLRETDRIPSYW